MPKTKSAQTCWICGSVADSSEHSAKKSDLSKVFGKGPYPIGQRLLKKGEDGKQALIQSPDSVHLKFENVICHYCNTTRTQPFDYAYEKFVSYLISNPHYVLKSRALNFNLIFGKQSRKCVANLYKYFVKAFGCALADSSIPVPTDMVNYILGNSYATKLRISFAVYEDLLHLSKNIAGVIQVHTLEGDESAVSFRWAYSIGWLTIIYWYDRASNPDLGELWGGKSKKAQLGSFSDETGI